MSISILVLAAGSSAVDDVVQSYPLCLSEVGGVSLIERIVGNMRSIIDASYIFALLEKEVEYFHLDKVVALLAPDPRVVIVPATTRGSACTALLAASQINPDDELLIVSANELVDCDLSSVLMDFKSRGLHGGTIVFRSIHPRYSYVSLDENGMVKQATQKNPISNHATAGIFWFKSAHDFVESAKENIRKNASISGNFYLAPTFNEMILKNRKIGIYRIENEKYFPLKNSRQVQQFESSSFL